MARTPGHGEGLFRKDREKLKELLVNAVKRAWNMLAPGGAERRRRRTWRSRRGSPRRTSRRPRDEAPLSEALKNRIREWSNSLLRPRTETTE